MKTSILILSPYMKLGGVEKSLITLLRRIPSDKYNVDLMLMSREGELLRFVPENINIVDPPFTKEVLACPDRSVWGVAKVLVKEKRILPFFKYIVAVLCMKILKNDALYAKCVTTGEDINKHYDFIFNYPGPNNLTSILANNYYEAEKKYTWIHREIQARDKQTLCLSYRLKCYDKIFAVSKSCGEQFSKLLPVFFDKVVVLYNVIDYDMYTELATLEEKSFDDVYTGTRILSVGRLAIEKGFDVAVEAAGILKNTGADFRWYIIGDGEEKDKLVGQIKDIGLEENVVLLGAKSNPYPYFRDCDIYVQPSRTEAYGLTIAEAKAFYKPVISTDFEGAREQIVNEETGLITGHLADDIAASLEKLILNKNLCLEISDNVKKELEKNIEQDDILKYL